jgi:hypothetical protein
MTLATNGVDRLNGCAADAMRLSPMQHHSKVFRRAPDAFVVALDPDTSEDMGA